MMNKTKSGIIMYFEDKI